MHPDFVDARTMLTVPRLDTLTEAQAGGADCPWCGRASSVPLGPRISSYQGGLRSWKPRACRQCVRFEAARVYGIHIQTCARCRHRDYCPDSVALLRLAG